MYVRVHVYMSACMHARMYVCMYAFPFFQKVSFCCPLSLVMFLLHFPFAPFILLMLRALPIVACCFWPLVCCYIVYVWSLAQSQASHRQAPILLVRRKLEVQQVQQLRNEQPI